MAINDWILLILSLALLLTPALFSRQYRLTLMRRSRLRVPLSDISEPSEREGESSIGRTLSMPPNWISGIRAAGGAYLLTKQWPILLGEEAAKHFPYEWIALAALAVGIVIQSFAPVDNATRPRGYKQKWLIVNPLCYGSGALLTALEPVQAVIVLSAGWTIAYTVNRIQLVAPIMALLVGATTYMVQGVEIFEFALAVLVVTPTAIATMAGRRVLQLI